MVQRRDVISGLGLCIVSGLAGCAGESGSEWTERDVDGASYRGRVEMFKPYDFSETEFVGNSVWLVQLDVQSITEDAWMDRLGVYILERDMEHGEYETDALETEKGAWVHLGDMVLSEEEEGGLGESRAPEGSEWFARERGENGWYGFQADDLLAITSVTALKDTYSEEIIDTVTVSGLQ